MLYVSNLFWMDQMPIFKEYNEFYKEDLSGITVKTKTGRTKITDYEGSIEYQLQLFYRLSTEYYLDHDLLYSLRDRCSDNSRPTSIPLQSAIQFRRQFCIEQSYYAKYGITTTSVS